MRIFRLAVAVAVVALPQRSLIPVERGYCGLGCRCRVGVSVRCFHGRGSGGAAGRILGTECRTYISAYRQWLPNNSGSTHVPGQPAGVYRLHTFKYRIIGRDEVVLVAMEALVEVGCHYGERHVYSRTDCWRWGWHIYVHNYLNGKEAVIINCI